MTEYKKYVHDSVYHCYRQHFRAMVSVFRVFFVLEKLEMSGAVPDALSPLKTWPDAGYPTTRERGSSSLQNPNTRPPPPRPKSPNAGDDASKRLVSVDPENNVYFSAEACEDSSYDLRPC